MQSYMAAKQAALALEVLLQRNFMAYMYMYIPYKVKII